MFNNELRNSIMTNLNESFQEIYDNFMKQKGDSAQSPDEIAKTFPIEILSYEDIFEVLHEAVQKRGYGHYGFFFKYEESTVARDSRISKRKVYTNFKQIVCWNGEIYERDGNYWVERKVLQDIRGNWHLWDGTYSIEVWVDDNKQSFTTNPPKPTKRYSMES